MLSDALNGPGADYFTSRKKVRHSRLLAFRLMVFIGACTRRLSVHDNWSLQHKVTINKELMALSENSDFGEAVVHTCHILNEATMEELNDPDANPPIANSKVWTS